MRGSVLDVAGLHLFLPVVAAAAAAAAAAASAFNFSALCSMKTLYSSAERLKRKMGKKENQDIQLLKWSDLPLHENLTNNNTLTMFEIFTPGQFCTPV